MKKVLFIAAAVAAMAACTKTQVVYDDADVEIGLSPVTYKSTKAPVYGPYETNSYNPAEKFNVFAVYTTQDKGTRFDALTADPTAYLTDVTFATRNNTVWGGSPTAYYWPKSGSLYFAGYSPSEVPQSSTTDITCSFTTDKGSVISIPNFLQGAYAYKNGKLLLRRINQLLDFRKAESGNMPVHITAVDIDSLSRLIVVIQSRTAHLQFDTSGFVLDIHASVEIPGLVRSGYLSFDHDIVGNLERIARRIHGRKGSYRMSRCHLYSLP